MPINSSNIKVTVRSGNRTANLQPITLKSQARTINTLADIGNVDENVVEDGYTLVYNAATDKYEVKKLDITDINIDSLDGGIF